MKTKKILMVMLVLLLAVSMLLAGCGGKTETPASSESTEATKTAEAATAANTSTEVPDKEQVINYPLYYDATIVDGTMTNSMMNATMIANINVTLTEIGQVDGELKIVGAGAEKWEVSEDGLEYTFHIRDFNWEDGVKVTAEQYAYSLYRALDPKNGSVMASALYDIKNAEEYVKGNAKKEDLGIAVIDENTLKITVKKVTPYFIQLTYSPVFTPTRQDFVEKYGDKYATEAEYTISCGPFKIAEWDHTSKILLVKNDKYWDAENVLLQQINFKMIKDTQAMMSEMMNHTIDRTSVSKGEWRQKFIDSGEFTYGDYILCGTYSLIANTQYETNGVKILSNSKVRQALSAAIDRTEATLLLQGEMAIPATGYIPSELQLDDKNYRDEAGYNPIESLQKAVTDPKALLIEGLKELGADPDPSKYTISYLVGNTTADGKKEAEYFQETYKTKLGINLEIEQVEASVKTQRAKDGDYGLSYVTSYADYNDPSTYLNSWLTYQEGHSYETGYNNKQYDQYVDAANNSINPAERLDLFKKAEKLLVEDDCIVFPIFHPMSSMMNASYVRGFINQNFAPTQFKSVYTVGRK